MPIRLPRHLTPPRCSQKEDHLCPPNTPMISGKASASSSPATPASKAAGWPSGWQHKGAVVRGYSLDPYTTPNLLTEADIAGKVEDLRGDIRNPATLEPALTRLRPRGRLSSGRPAAGPALLRRPHRHLRDQRHRHRARARCRKPDAIRQGRGLHHDRQMLREQGVGVGLSRNRSPRRLRPLLLVESLRGNCFCRLPPVVFPEGRRSTSRRHAPAM